ncbi:MAG: hypothetical protein LBC64_07480 [Fibromonadaceae bacterium]|nr:hypothetical protein [Fibromonadaceae bacterium]
MECFRVCLFARWLCQLEPLGVFEGLPFLARSAETIVKSLELHQKRLNIFEGLSVCLVCFCQLEPLGMFEPLPLLAWCALPVRAAWSV